MKSIYLFAISLVTGIMLLAGCSGTKMKGTEKSDDPLGRMMVKKNKLAKTGVLSEVAIAESRDLQTGIDKVELETRGKLARSLESRTLSLQKQFKEEVGEDYVDHFSQATKNITSKIIKGSTLIETVYQEINEGEFRVFGIMAMDPKLFAEALSQEMAANEAMKNRWLASKAYEDLSAEAVAFEKWKKEQTYPHHP